jgi:hypothetical protein
VGASFKKNITIIVINKGVKLRITLTVTEGRSDKPINCAACVIV